MGHTTEKGMTMIEIMIVIAIMAILVSVAIPAYANYQTRAKIAEGLNVASAAVTAVSLHQIETNHWPADNVQAGLADTIETSHVRDIQVSSNGQIVVTIKNEVTKTADDKTFKLTPSLSPTGNINWRCDPPGTLNPDVLPGQCRA